HRRRGVVDRDAGARRRSCGAAEVRPLLADHPPVQRPDPDRAAARGPAARGGGGGGMKLVTYDDGRVGRIDGDEIVRLDVPDMRTYFERGGADDAGERVPLQGARLRAPIVPKKFFHTAGNFREHDEESKRVAWSHKV